MSLSKIALLAAVLTAAPLGVSAASAQDPHNRNIVQEQHVTNTMNRVDRPTDRMPSDMHQSMRRDMRENMQGDHNDRRHHGWDRRHRGWERGRGNWHRHCHWMWRHHHRVRVCR